jgi:hypothetical protein
LPAAGKAAAWRVAGTSDAVGFGAVVRGARSATALPATTPEATGTGAPAAVRAGAAPGTWLEEALAHAVTAAAATRQPIPAKRRRSVP